LARSGVSSLPLFQWQTSERNTLPTNLPFLNLRWKLCWLLKFVWISDVACMLLCQLHQEIWDTYYH
jgi:hypothetical protein